MLIDEATIKVRSGKGGDGVIHFRREKYEPRGGPDGGDGGRGGDVILRVVPTLNTLYSFRHQTRYQADNGANGAKQNMSGKSGQDLFIPIPPGTLVYKVESGELLGDMTQSDQELIVARGGRGGRGNARFASSRDQAPRHAEKGEPAQEFVLKLELKLVADIGIVGIPNAGKSTLLASATRAKPKIASYPFTTLEPNLGVAELDEGKTIVLADIPGLIEGAHQGVGLGYEFLRHIQRTRVLIHLLDGLSDDPITDFAQINSEMALFDPNLALKPQVVVLNKIDIPEVKQKWPALKKVLRKQAKLEAGNLFAISAATGDGVKDVIYQAALRLNEVSEIQTEQEDRLPVYRMETDPSQFTIHRDTDGWHVKGESIERAAAMTYWDYDASIRRFSKLLKTLGIEDALRKTGVQEGDTVYIGDYELEWSD
jgi:GTPase